MFTFSHLNRLPDAGPITEIWDLEDARKAVRNDWENPTDLVVDCIDTALHTKIILSYPCDKKVKKGDPILVRQIGFETSLYSSTFTVGAHLDLMKVLAPFAKQIRAIYEDLAGV
jgi:hypothetical protein